jgi:hypothetical protein
LTAAARAQEQCCHFLLDSAVVVIDGMTSLGFAVAGMTEFMQLRADVILGIAWGLALQTQYIDPSRCSG